MRNGTKLALYQHNTSKERKTRRRCITNTERPKPQEHPVPERLHPKTCNETNQASQTKIPKPEAPRRNPANVKDKKDLRETLVSRRNATQRSRFLFPFPSGLSPREPRGTCSGRLQVGPRPGVAVKRGPQSSLSADEVSRLAAAIDPISDCVFKKETGGRRRRMDSC